MTFAACAAVAPEPRLLGLPEDCEQAVVVRAVAGGGSAARWQAWERDGARWRAVGGEVACVVGRSGVVSAEAKREGDGGTPAGAWAVRRAFGAEPALATGLRYVQATADDHWIDAPDSPQYNQWVVGKPAVSAEALRRDDGQYDLVAALEYNTDPVVPGKGSAIFLHVWSAPGVATSGCVAAAEPDVRALLRWLDAARTPAVVVAAD